MLLAKEQKTRSGEEQSPETRLRYEEIQFINKVTSRVNGQVTNGTIMACGWKTKSELQLKVYTKVMVKNKFQETFM